VGFARFLLWLLLSLLSPVFVSVAGLGISVAVALAVSVVVGVIYYWPAFVPLILPPC